LDETILHGEQKLHLFSWPKGSEIPNITPACYILRTHVMCYIYPQSGVKVNLKICGWNH